MDSIPETDKIDMAYLKSDKLGKVITRGLAELYRKQPQFPIEYLANWLLNYCQTERNRGLVHEHENHKQALHDKLHMEKVSAQELQDEQLQCELQQANVEMEFISRIKAEEFHEKMLNEFCDFLVKKDLTGVYVGYVDFPTRPIRDEDDEEFAHLDQEQPKVLKYVAANNSHNFMLSRTLALDQGITGEVFREIPPPEEGQLPQSPVVYVKAVTQEPKMVFFKWPKLGAFLAIPMIYHSCLFPAAFDAGIEERLRFRKATIEKHSEKEQKIQTFNDKIKEATDAEQDVTPIQEELETFLAEWKDEEEAPFQSQKRQFVVSFDTLGLDTEISEQRRQYFENNVTLFAEQWQSTEQRLLSNDIDHYLQYIEQGVPKDRSEVLNLQEDQAVDQLAAQFDDLKDREKEHLFEMQSLRLNVILQQILTLQSDFLSLKQFRVLKYPGILQALLLFLGYQKIDINQTDTNVLDWDRCKLYLDDDLFQKISEYNHRGAKPKDIQPYGKLNRISKRLTKYTVEQVDEYNVGYSKILKWLQLVVKVRQADIEIRREKIKKLRLLIETTSAEVQRIKDEKEKQLEEKKQSLTEEDQGLFNAEEWAQKYDEDNPLPLIPADVEDEVDKDFEEEL